VKCSLEKNFAGMENFNEVHAYFKKTSVNLLWDNCMAISVDEALAILGHTKAKASLPRTPWSYQWFCGSCSTKES